jgi:hypothetical protein
LAADGGPLTQNSEEQENRGESLIGRPDSRA